MRPPLYERPRTLPNPSLGFRESQDASFKEQPGLLTMCARQLGFGDLENLPSLEVVLKVVEVAIIVHSSPKAAKPRRIQDFCPTQSE